MLFDDDEQVEVRHVISLAHHNISIYSGGDKTPEGELFIKRNAICLSRRPGGPELGPDTQVSKPFYLFSEHCSAKEDFYFALLRNQQQTLSLDSPAPSPATFDIKHIISLVQRLHSSEEHMHTRWLNAMIGRIFLGTYRTSDMENFVRKKLTKKISRVKRPSFLSNITIQRIDTGESAPYITNPRLKDLTVEGECCMEADVKYTGNFRLEVAATARIELGSRLKAREVGLVLAVVLRKLEGHVLLKIKPPPSNRVWFSFQSMPKMEMSIEPIVSSRQITYTVILRQIENRIKEVIAETLVLPFWDDVPFFKTEHKNWRGGIFQGDDAVEPSPDPETNLALAGDVDDVDQLEEDDSAEPPPGPPLTEKSQSMPVLEATTKSTGFFGRRKAVNKGIGTLASSASASTTSMEINTGEGAERRASRRSSFLSSPTPNISTDSLDAESVKPATLQSERSTGAVPEDASTKADDASLASNPAAALYRPYITSKSPSQASISSRETAEVEIDKNSNSSSSGSNEKSCRTRRGTGSSAGSHDDVPPQSSTSTPKASSGSGTAAATRALFPHKENAAGDDTAPPHSPGISEREQQRRNALAAVTNAAASAKRWGLHALQRHNDSNKNGKAPGDEASVDLKQPMGRGRPLPPPGTPLPMPDKKTKTAPPPVPKRKPVPPPVSQERPSPGHQEHTHTEQRRPVPPPPLPRRRHVPASDQQESEDTGMLVVEAPAESEPTTPLSATHSSSYVQPWAEDVEDVDGGVQPSGGIDVPRRKGLDLVGLTRTRSDELARSESASTSGAALTGEARNSPNRKTAHSGGGDDEKGKVQVADSGSSVASG